MAADWTKVATSLGAEMKILRLITAMQERAGKTGANYFRTLIQDTGAYDRTVDEDARAIGFDIAHYDGSLLPRLRDLFKTYRSIISNQAGWAGVLAREINMADSDKSLASFIAYRYENVNLGEISILERLGALGAMYKQMVLDGEYVVSNFVSGTAMTARGTTIGSLDDSLLDENSYLSNCHTGILTFRCVNESTTAPQMAVQLTIAPNNDDDTLSLGLPDGTIGISAENNLTVDKPFDDLRIGLQNFELHRDGLDTPTITGDSVATPLISSVSVETPYDGDCYKGQFYIRITREATAPEWYIEYFSDSGRTNKVGSSISSTLVGTEVLSETLYAGSVVTFTFSRANAASVLASATDYQDITIDVLTPRLGDTWEIVVTNEYNGTCATLLAKTWPIALPAIPKTPSTAVTAALAGAGAGNVNNGTHSWKVTFVGPGGESPVNGTSNVLNVVDKTANGKVSLTAIPVGAAGTGVTARNIYRTVAGNGGSYKYVAQIADNVTTIYQDNTADASLGTIAPTSVQFDDTLFTAISIS